MILIRPIMPEEVSALDDFLYEAIFVPQGVDSPPRSIIENDDLQVYVRNFGDSPHDHCLVAESEGKIVGAVWARIMDDYGHIDNQTPSLAISLFKEYRGQGIGTQLLRQMLDLLRQKGYGQVSLSVQKENYALQMYQKAGFHVVADRGEEVLMASKSFCVANSNLIPFSSSSVDLLPSSPRRHPLRFLGYNGCRRLCRY